MSEEQPRGRCESSVPAGEFPECIHNELSHARIWWDVTLAARRTVGPAERRTAVEACRQSRLRRKELLADAARRARQRSGDAHELNSGHCVDVSTTVDRVRFDR
jgi:hypothetical protein